MSKRFRFLLVLVILIVATVFLLPSYKWYISIDREKKLLAAGSREEIRNYAISLADSELKKIDRALTVDEKDADLPEVFLFFTSEIKSILENRGEEIPKEWTVGDLVDNLPDPEYVRSELQNRFLEEMDDIKDIQDRIITLGLDLSGGMKITIEADFSALEKELGRTLSDDDRETAMQGVMEILNNRIDQFGVVEPQIRRLADKKRIVIEMPGAADPERIRKVIRGKGRLKFHLVDRDSLALFQQYAESNPGPYLDTDGVTLLDPAVSGILAKGTVLRGFYRKDSFGIDRREGYTVVQEIAGLDGERIRNAYVRQDSLTGRPEVLFDLDSAGAESFYNLTSVNKGEDLAVLLDDKVKAKATIQTAIRTPVRVTGFDTEEATDLALVLKTGALPVPLEIISQEAVGASLGEDAIRVGLRSIALGLALVLLFMLLYYRGAGIIADIALLFNFYMMASILSVFNFTLTLPGIAGFILTVGMAVDANVIIFERIKEEYRLGKSREAAIKAGFAKAFWTIMDANITTGIAALSLAYFGTGPIAGFAVMLAVGIVCSMISALFISRLMFNFNTDVFKASRISISWRPAK